LKIENESFKCIQCLFFGAYKFVLELDLLYNKTTILDFVKLKINVFKKFSPITI
jgi:hypothetical protein